MSTYYYLVCDKHNESLMVATTAGDHVAANADFLLGYFVIAHCYGCHIQIASESDIDRVVDQKGSEYEDWDMDNWEAMRDKSREQPNPPGCDPDA